MSELNLRDALREALNSYHDLESLALSPLSNLQVVHLLRPKMVSSTIFPLQAKGLGVRWLLDEAMIKLDQDKPEASDLLRKRFRQERSAQELSEASGTGPSTIYDHQSKAVTALAAIVTKMEVEVAAAGIARIRSLTAQLPVATYREFIGQEPTLAQVIDALPTTPAIHHHPLAITGLGGLGKTSVLREALYQWVTEQQPELEHILWATVVQTTDAPGMLAERRQRFSLEHVLNQLADQLDEPLTALASNDKRLRALANRLSQESSILVIDNVETTDEVALAVAIIESLGPVAQILITSRHRLDHWGVRALELRELAEPEVVRLLEAEARRLCLEALDETTAREVWQHVGGNPLALKLVVAQTAILPITRVLDGLREHSTSMQHLLAHIYDTAWWLLSPTAQELLLGLVTLPLVGATWEGLKVATGSDGEENDGTLEQALDELAALNLVQVSPALDHAYSLHRLTYRFLEWKLGFGTGLSED